jgi:hypothetical protein
VGGIVLTIEARTNTAGRRWFHTRKIKSMARHHPRGHSDFLIIVRSLNVPIGREYVDGQ